MLCDNSSKKKVSLTELFKAKTQKKHYSQCKKTTTTKYESNRKENRIEEYAKYIHTLVFNKLDFMNKGCRGVRGACILIAYNKDHRCMRPCICVNIGCHDETD